MKYQDIFWHLFERSGDPDAYVQYKRQHEGDPTGRAMGSGRGPGTRRGRGGIA